MRNTNKRLLTIATSIGISSLLLSSACSVMQRRDLPGETGKAVDTRDLDDARATCHAGCVAEAKAVLANAAGVTLLDETKDGRFPQPIHAEGCDDTFVGRVRLDPSNPNALNLWVVSDNLRKGAASNAVQCAEELIKRGIVK